MIAKEQLEKWRRIDRYSIAGIESLREAVPTLIAEVVSLEAALKLVRRERDDARANARILAHSYTHDSRPPARAVTAALESPAIPDPS